MRGDAKAKAVAAIEKIIWKGGGWRQENGYSFWNADLTKKNCLSWILGLKAFNGVGVGEYPVLFLYSEPLLVGSEGASECA